MKKNTMLAKGGGQHRRKHKHKTVQVQIWRKKSKRDRRKGWRGVLGQEELHWNPQSPQDTQRIIHNHTNILYSLEYRKTKSNNFLIRRTDIELTFFLQ